MKTKDINSASEVSEDSASLYKIKMGDLQGNTVYGEYMAKRE
jgi:hypothetical protein